MLNKKLNIANACGQGQHHQQQQDEQQAGLKKAGAQHESFILNKKLNIANACGQEQHHQQQGEQQAGGMTLLERCFRACHKLPIGPRTLPETLQQLCQS